MRKTIGLICLGWLFTGTLLAQSLVDSIKFEIIRETVHFLALDGKISKDTGLLVQCPSNDYTCMEKQLASNTIQGLQSRVKSWKTKPSQSPEDLIRLRDEIHAEIIERDGKTYRKEFAAYPDYLSRLEVLIEASDENSYPIELNGQTDEQQAGNRQTEPAAPVNSSQTGAGTSPLSSGSTLLYLTLAIALLALGISLWTFFRKQDKKETDSLQRQINLLKTELLALPVKKNEKTMMDGLDLHRLKMESLEKRLVEIGAVSRTSPAPEKGGSLAKKQTPAYSPPVTKESPPESSREVRYAKFLDLENGFSQARLKNAQNGELAYEILIDGDAASYAVSEDPRAQKYAVFTFEHLKPGCEFENQPHEGAKITTLKRGSLVKSGAAWMIQTKAVIRFS